jgi:hypothetical protein
LDWSPEDGFNVMGTNLRYPEAYMELPPKYVPHPQPKWDWQDGKFSPSEGVEIRVSSTGNGYWFEISYFMPGYVTTEREAKLAAEEWWAGLKELTK